jgi:hypothetical protein
MHFRLMHLIKRLFPYFIFLILCLAPLFWIPTISGKQFLGYGDYLSPINITKELFNLFSVYNKHEYGGFDSSVGLSALIPYWIIIFITHSINIPPIIGTLIYMSISILIAQISMFLWLKYQLKSIPYNTILTILGAIIYAYAPYLFVYIWPGQMANYTPYSLFPLIFLICDQILKSKTIKIITLVCFIFILSFFTNETAWGIGAIYIFFWAITGYSFIQMVVYHIPLARQFKNIFTIFSITILSNSYWIIPWLFVGFSQTPKIGQSSVINNRVDLTSYYSSIAGLLLGRSDGSIPYLYHHIVVTSVPFWLLVIGLICGFYFLGKSKQFLTNSGMLLFSLYITKGTCAPFSNIFMWLFNHFPGFTTFRRPVNKFAGVYMLFLVTVGLQGLMSIESRFPKYQKILRVIIYIIFGIGSIGLIFPIASHILLSTFTVPSYYQEAWNSISKENPSRVLLLPGLYGVQPTFGKTLDNYHGYDFLYKIWDISIVYPDDSGYSPEFPVKKQITETVHNILNSKDTCVMSRKSGLSHIVIRQDLDKLNTLFELAPVKYYEMVKKSGIWSNEKFFGKGNGGINVFTLKSECRNTRIFVSSKSGNIPSKITPVTNTKIIIDIQSTSLPLSVYFLDNYSPWWKLIPGDNLENSWWDDMLLLFHPKILMQSHLTADNWANKWDMPTNSRSSNIYILYYLPQSAVYFGILFWFFWIIIFILFFGLAKIFKK